MVVCEVCKHKVLNDDDRDKIVYKGMCKICVETPIVRAELNEKLKSVRNYEDLSEIINQAKDRDFPFSLVTKRRGREIFSINDSFKKKIRYLYDDGVSSGSCKYENIYKFFEFI